MRPPVIDRGRQAIRSVIRHVLLALLGSLVVIAATGYLYGIPAPLAAHLLRWAGPSRYALQAERLRLRGIGIRLYGSRLYRMGLPGPPGLEADVVDVSFSPLRWMAGYDGIASIRVKGGDCRPDQLFVGQADVSERLGRPSLFSFELVECTIARVRIARCSGTIRSSRDAIIVQSLQGHYQSPPESGFVSGSLHVDLETNRMSGDLVLQHDPRQLLPVIEDYGLRSLARLIGMFEFPDAPPRIGLRFRYDPHARDLHVMGDLRLRDFRFRAIPSIRADGQVVVHDTPTNTIVAIDRLFLQRPEGQVSGGVSLDDAHDQVQFDIQSTIDPFALSAMTGVGEAFLRRSFSFSGPVRSWFVGMANYEDLTDTAFRARVETGNGSILSVPFNGVVFDAEMTGHTLRLPALSIELMDGTIEGWFECEFPALDASDERMPLALGVSLRDLDLHQGMRIMAGVESSDAFGRVHGELDIKGVVDDALDWHSVNGRGTLRVRNGRVFMLPLFGGLSRVMTTIIPGLDFVLRQSDARAAFNIENGLMRIERLTIDGDILSLSARGSLTLPDALELDAQVRLLKEHTLVARLLRVITYPISKLFEFRVAGPVSNPVWYPVNFSTDLLDRLGLERKEPGAD